MYTKTIYLLIQKYQHSLLFKCYERRSTKERRSSVFSKSNTLFLVCWMLSIGNNCIANPVMETSVKIMTYNIRLDFEGDGDNNWHHRKTDLVQYLQTQEPDFIGIQEALYHQVTFLDENLSDYKFIGVGRDDGVRKGEFMAVFYNKNKWAIETDSTFWLSPSPERPSMGWDAGCYRVCTYGVFTNENADTLALFNTHFDHVGLMARKQSVEVLQNYIAPLSKKWPTILTGDFNVTPDDSVYTSLCNFLADCYLSAKEIKAPFKGTFNSFKLTGLFERRIDYIFVNNQINNVKKYRIEAPLTKLKRQLSDHFPVIVELEIE